MIEPYERLPNESAKAFAAFTTYLSLGPERCILEACRLCKKGTTVLGRWSSKHNWVERSRDYDARLLKVEVELQDAELRIRAVDWVTRRGELKELEFDVAKKVLKKLQAFLEKDTGLTTYRDVAHMLDVASKVGRLAVGLATEHSEVTGAEGGAIQIEFNAALKKVYGNLIDLPASELRVVAGNLSDAGTEGRLPVGSNGELHASERGAATEAAPGELCGAAV